MTEQLLSDLKKWYVVRAVSGQEAKIKDYIMSEVNSPRFGYDHLVEDILVPTEKVIQIRNGKKNKQRTGLFSRIYYG